MKGTVTRISSDPPLHAKMAIKDAQRYLWTFYLVNREEDIVFFLGVKIYNKFFFSRNAEVTFVEKLQLKIISFKNH